MQIFETHRGEPEKVLDAGGQVEAVVWVGGRGRRSGADAMARVAHVFTFRNDKLLTFTELRDVEQALEAAGLRE
jgi:ketosteroid isomerase-like protein